MLNLIEVFIMSKQVIDARADAAGNITHIKSEGNKNFTPINIAIKMAQKGAFSNIHVVTTKNGSTYLRSNPDHLTKNNLDEMAKN